MNCIKCYQEIPEGSKFCPYCGAEQTAAPEAGTADTQVQSAVQPESGAQDHPYSQLEGAAQQDANVQTGTGAQQYDAQDNMYRQQTANTQQDAQNYSAGYQGTSGYGSGYQNDAQQNNYQNSYQNNYQNSGDQNNYQNGYQNGNCQTPYQQNQGESVNGTPYLVMSIVLTVISTICCCLFTIPFGVVAIVYSAKINSAVAAGNIEDAKKAEKMAKIWLIVAAAVAVVSIIISLVFGIMIGEGTYYYNYY